MCAAASISGRNSTPAHGRPLKSNLPRPAPRFPCLLQRRGLSRMATHLPCPFGPRIEPSLQNAFMYVQVVQQQTHLLLICLPQSQRPLRMATLMMNLRPSWQRYAHSTKSRRSGALSLAASLECLARSADGMHNDVENRIRRMKASQRENKPDRDTDTKRTFLEI
jgi:hypothetical protein